MGDRYMIGFFCAICYLPYASSRTTKSPRTGLFGGYALGVSRGHFIPHCGRWNCNTWAEARDNRWDVVSPLTQLSTEKPVSRSLKQIKPLYRRRRYKYE